MEDLKFIEYEPDYYSGKNSDGTYKKKFKRMISVEEANKRIEKSFKLGRTESLKKLELLKEKLNKVSAPCQIKNTKYCLCNCGKHKENGDY